LPLGRRLKASGLKMPSVQIKEVTLERISLRDVDLLFRIEIANPYPVALELENVTFDLDVAKNRLFSSTTRSGFKIKAKATASSPLRLNLQYAKIASIVQDFVQKDALVCDISGELRIPLPKLPGLPKLYKHPFRVL
jgi:LEA14-like dessication related protein